MESSSASANSLRFGLYEVDLAAGELRKRGRKVVLQEQPFKLLTLLLRRPGEVVTREELQQALWPTDTFVEFDESLNKAVQKLRQALGDSSDNPHLIETVPRHGYRFIAQVEMVRQDQDEDPQCLAPDKASTSSFNPGWIARERTFWAASLAVALGIILAVWIRWPAAVPAEVRKYTLLLPGGFCKPVISPDGRHFAYIAVRSGKQTDQHAGIPSESSLWIQDFQSEKPREIGGTGGAHDQPFWSPDSALLGLAVKRQLWRVSAQSGGASPICEFSDVFVGGTWSQDGRSIFFSILRQGIYEVPVRGGVPKMLVPVDPSAAGDHFADPYLLPSTDGDRHILYAAQRIGAIHDIILHSLKSGKKTVLVRNAFHPVYSPSGHILYSVPTGVLEPIQALPFSIASMSVTGDPFTLAPNGPEPSAARDGTLLYWGAPSYPRIQLTWHDRTGKKIASIGPPEPIETMALSADGRSVALNLIAAEGQGGLWILDTTRGTLSRLTFSPQTDLNPVWSPTGREVAFSSDRLGHMDIYAAATSSTDQVKPVATSSLPKWANDWSPDGQFLIYEMEDPKRGYDLWYSKPKPGGGYESTPFLCTPADERAAKFSPDGHFVAYVSNESGRPEVYVRRFPDGGGMRRISLNGGSLPSWRKDGKELFYLEGTTLVSVGVATNPVLSIGGTRRLFTSPNFANVQLSAGFNADPMYGISRDGQRFLFPEFIGQVEKPVIHVVENWFEEFKNRTASTR